MSKHKPFITEKPSHRPVRFAERVREELVDFVPKSLKDPRLYGIKMLTILNVEVTPDLRNGKVMFSLMGQEPDAKRIKEIEQALNHAAGYIKKELMLRLATKNTPLLMFKYDKGLDKAFELTPLFNEIANDPKVENDDDSDEF